VCVLRGWEGGGGFGGVKGGARSLVVWRGIGGQGQGGGSLVCCVFFLLTNDSNENTKPKQPQQDELLAGLDVGLKEDWEREHHPVWYEISRGPGQETERQTL
jgi:hypothetical protein